MYDISWNLFNTNALRYVSGNSASAAEDLKSTINNLKLRASYGQLGNQNTLNGYYPAQSVVNLGTNYIFDKNIVSGAITAMANSLISWETTTSTNLGLDLKLFDKLEINAEYYYRQTNDILLNLSIPLIIGLSVPAQNAGKLESRGWEVGATYNDRFGDFNFSAMFNISGVRNKVPDLKGINETGITVNREGYPMYSLYGYEADEYIVPEYYDGDGIPDAGDGVINTSDYVIMGSTIPRYTFGLRPFGEYKGIDLNILFQGTGKADGFAACSDFLDKAPLDSPSDKTFLANETEIQMAVTGCYTTLWTAHEDMPFFLAFEELSDNGWDRNTK